MYKNFHFDRNTNTCHLWTDEAGKEYQSFKYDKYAYIVDPKGEYTTLTGLKVKKVKNWGKESELAGMVFEHDVPVATRVLIDRYYESDEPSKGHTVMFFDIEVEKGLKYSSARVANNKITSVAFAVDGKYTCLLLDERGTLQDSIRTVKITNTENTIQVNLKVYKTESSLLMAFVAEFNRLNVSILSSWNGDTFDCPYIYNRITNVLGSAFADKLSPIKIVESREIGKRRDVVIKIAGVAQMDYLQLYKKFTYNEESSYKLESIAQKELKRGKFQYDGTLDDLYNNDIDGFIEYNVNDVELLVALDKKLDFIEIARGICHKGHVPYDDFKLSSYYLDGAIQTRCKQKNIISISNPSKLVDFEIGIDEIYVKNKDNFVSVQYYLLCGLKLTNKQKIYEFDGDSYVILGTFLTEKQKSNGKNYRKNTIIVTMGKAKGAFVKPPTPGKHKWVYSIDAQSLYPSLIIMMNISLETQIAKVENWGEYHLPSKLNSNISFNQLSNFGYLDVENITLTPITHDLFSEISTDPITLTKDQFITYIKDNNATISSSGVIFTGKKKGIVPLILEEWFEERLHYKNKMKEYLVGSPEYLYYDRKQLITKILLNSLYGVLLLPSFRYYSKLSGESVTLSGQTVIKFADHIANLYYKNKLGNAYKNNCVIYQDSDSCYLDAKPLIANFDQLSDFDRVIETKKISNEVSAFINKAAGWLVKESFHSSNNRLFFNQEKISKRALWGQAKKRYAQLSVDIDVNGNLIEKVNITGFDAIKSSFPKTFRHFTKEILEDILYDVEMNDLNAKIRTFKSKFNTNSIFDIMLPTSVKEISKYQYGQKGTPIHVKSAHNYNKFLNLHKIESLPPVDDGDKIIYAYMKQNPYGFEVMALKGQDEDPPQAIEFVEKYIDRDKVFSNTLITKLDTIWGDLGWGSVQLNEIESDYF